MKKMTLILAVAGSLFTANAMAAPMHAPQDHSPKPSHHHQPPHKHKKPVLKKKVPHKAKHHHKMHH